MIYLLRHGETIFNTAGRFQGQLDSPLTDRGIQQACQMGRRLACEICGIEDLIELQVSPLGRTKETATWVADFVPLTIQYDSRLQEISLGSWDGMTFYEIDHEYPGSLDGSSASDWFFRSPDGETFECAVARAAAWLASVTNPTIAISHAVIGRLIRGTYLGLSRDEMLALPVPQSGFHRLRDGRIDLVE